MGLPWEQAGGRGGLERLLLQNLPERQCEGFLQISMPIRRLFSLTHVGTFLTWGLVVGIANSHLLPASQAVMGSTPRPPGGKSQLDHFLTWWPWCLGLIYGKYSEKCLVLAGNWSSGWISLAFTQSEWMRQACGTNSATSL